MSLTREPDILSCSGVGGEIEMGEREAEGTAITRSRTSTWAR